MINKIGLLTRNIPINAMVGRAYHGGVPGENLPFSIKNRYRLTLLFALFWGSAMGAPFLILRHQLKKK